MYPSIIFLYNLNVVCKILECKNKDNWNISFDFGLSTRLTKKSRRRFLLTLWKTLVTCVTSKRRTSNSFLIKYMNMKGWRLRKITRRDWKLKAEMYETRLFQVLDNELMLSMQLGLKFEFLIDLLQISIQSYQYKLIQLKPYIKQRSFLHL